MSEPDDELRLLRNLMISVVEAMARNRPMKLLPEQMEMVFEWLDSPAAKQIPVVTELIGDLNRDTKPRPLNRHERRLKQKGSPQ